MAPAAAVSPRPTFATYSSRTLEGNWYEERFQASAPQPEPIKGPSALDVVDPLVAASQGRESFIDGAQHAPHHERVAWVDTRRCIPADFPEGWSNAWVTSKQADSAHLHEVPARRKLPLMLCSAAVQQRALQHSQMLGSSLHGHPYPQQARRDLHGFCRFELPPQAKSELETTHRHFYADKPAEARSLHPEQFAAPDRKHFIHAGLTKECMDNTRQAEGPQGRAGARGPISRHPGEPGAPWGTSVFWDGYSAGLVGPCAKPGGVWG